MSAATVEHTYLAVLIVLFITICIFVNGSVRWYRQASLASALPATNHVRTVSKFETECVIPVLVCDFLGSDWVALVAQDTTMPETFRAPKTLRERILRPATQEDRARSLLRVGWQTCGNEDRTWITIQQIKYKRDLRSGRFN